NNTPKDTENRIRQETAGRRFRFGGGLVPSVDVYGYITHMPVARWGRARLEGGTAECRFFTPIYDGETATVIAGEDAAGLEIIVESHGERCATGRAALPGTPATAPALASFPKVAQRAQRPPADETSRAVCIWPGLA